MRKREEEYKVLQALLGRRSQNDGWMALREMHGPTGMLPGTLHPIIARLETQGVVETRVYNEATPGGTLRRRLYRISPDKIDVILGELEGIRDATRNTPTLIERVCNWLGGNA